jgi:hypothetical protein
VSVAEAVAFFLAQAVKIGLAYALFFTGSVNTIYRLALQCTGTSGGGYVFQFALYTFWTLIAFFCFLILRSMFGATPVRIGGVGKRGAINTNGEELGAYSLASAMWIAFYMVFGNTVVASLRLALPGAAAAIGLGTSVTGSIAVFVIFILLRRAFSGDMGNPANAASRPRR